MAYNALAHDELEDATSETSSVRSSSVPPTVPQHAFQQIPMEFSNLGSASSDLFMADQHESHNVTSTTRGALGNKVQSLLAKQNDAQYEMVENDDYNDDAPRSASPAFSYAPSKASSIGINVQRQRPKEDSDKDISPAQSFQSATTRNNRPFTSSIAVPRPLRAASTHSTKMRHPTPDLQTLQGAYVSNIEQLEKSAEQLSMTSSIDDAIREMHEEQKRADSRRSSLLSTQNEASNAKQLLSVSTSIIDTNNTARSGGYSPGGFNMISPRSISGSRAGSSSKGSRFGRMEPDLEGRPLDAFILPSPPSNHSAMSRSASIAGNVEENGSTMTRAVIDPQYGIPVPAAFVQQSYVLSQPEEHDERPGTSHSANTMDQAHEMFDDFDGEHYTPGARGDLIGSRRRQLSSDSTPGARGEVVGSRPRNVSGPQQNADRRVSSQTRPAVPRPTTYADPTTGQQMVYYPAPVPMMLNLPPKLSKRPASNVIDKRKTQALSTFAPDARQSAVWLADVLEDDNGEQEASRTTPKSLTGQERQADAADAEALEPRGILPPHLRASAFFDQPRVSEKITIKGDSAVATLDSILDASAYAPVNAFTDHAFAGTLGAEVYGADKRVSSMPVKMTKRNSSMQLLGKRSSSANLLGGEDNRKSTMSSMLGFKKFEYKKDMLDDDIPGIGMKPQHREPLESDDESDPELDGQLDDEIYQGPPTTLLAELQLRKQQQQRRLKPQYHTNGMQTTYMEREAVAAIETRNRKKGRVNLAWEDPHQIAQEDNQSDDEDVPLAVLYQSAQEKQKAIYDPMRPMGLMETRDVEDNEPLSRRRDRITGRLPPPKQDIRASTLTLPLSQRPESTIDAEADKNEEEQGGMLGNTATIRPVSGDFASEMMSQLGIDDKKDGDVKGLTATATPISEEEETLGQRRKRLQAEREARQREVSGGSGPKPSASNTNLGRPIITKRRSMADVLEPQPAPGSVRASIKRVGSSGLLGMHEQQKAARASTMIGLGREAAMSRENVRPQPQQNHTVYGQQQYVPQQAMPPQSTHGAQSVYGMPQAYTSLYGTPGGNLGNYSQQQLMMPNIYGRPQGYGGAAGSQVMQHPVYGNGLHGANNPMAQSMLQLQIQMEQMSNMLAERQMNLGQGRVDMVERWREGVLQ